MNRHSPLVIAHRGASHHALENTIEAFAKAVQAHAGMVEMDVRLTRDQRVVVFHDAGLRRLFKKPGRISRLTYEQIADRSAGRIPLLETVLAQFHGQLQFYIELKVQRIRRRARQTLVEKVAQIIAHERVSADCLVASFDHRAVQAYRQMHPHAHTGFIFSSMRSLRHPRRHGFSSIDVLCPHQRLLTARRMAEWTKLHKKIFVWVLDKPHAQQAAIELGVDGIVTNDPASLVRMLQDR